jgi:hypothetical protein
MLEIRRFHRSLTLFDSDTKADHALFMEAAGNGRLFFAAAFV